jgi:hypothetical protein
MVYYCGKEDVKLQARHGRFGVWMNLVYQLLHPCELSEKMSILRRMIADMHCFLGSRTV